MKSIYLLALCFFSIFISSCESEETNKEQVKFAVPKLRSLAAIRNNVYVSSAKQTKSDGKIYVAENFLFYIAKEQGVHVFNNTNPSVPQNSVFINIEGVHDISVKGNYLFADNFFDLLVFDISNIQNITLVKTVENVISFSPVYPIDAQNYHWFFF